MNGKDGRPQARAIIFSKYTDGLSRLYFFNTMLNSESPSKGIIQFYHFKQFSMYMYTISHRCIRLWIVQPT